MFKEKSKNFYVSEKRLLGTYKITIERQVERNYCHVRLRGPREEIYLGCGNSLHEAVNIANDYNKKEIMKEFDYGENIYDFGLC